MTNAHLQLSGIASEAVAPPFAVHSEHLNLFSNYGDCGVQLRELLGEKNGFYAYESALLVRPTVTVGNIYSIHDWNAHELWRRDYAIDLRDFLFFAEDIFGNQFGLSRDAIWQLDVETGDTECLAESLHKWFELILDDYEFQTAYPLSHAWQKENGSIARGQRLVPKVPFVCGGEYNVQNVAPINDVIGMRSRANLANQIRNRKDREQIVFRIID